jgi:RNA-binding protein 25
MQPNRLGLGLRPALPSFGQGPSISALAQQQHMQHFIPAQIPKQTALFVGSISGGITDAFLNQLLSVSYQCFLFRLILTSFKACGQINSFKRLITPANKPQGFGFAEFVEPEGALRALALLNGVELPALEDGCANKKLLVRLIPYFSPISLLLRITGKGRRKNTRILGRVSISAYED